MSAPRIVPPTGSPLTPLLDSAPVTFESRRPTDPRIGYWPPPRTFELLHFIGEGAEVTQPQVHERLFASCVESIVSRCAQKLARRNHIAIDRWNGVGVNRLRLTGKGRDLLVSSGVPVEQLFVLRKPVAPA